jgi:outer membrane protein assembly factor BamB
MEATVPANGPPVVGGGAVWVTDYHRGVLYELDPGSGATRAQIDVGELPHFASPSLAGDHVYLGTMDGSSPSPLLNRVLTGIGDLDVRPRGEGRSNHP